MNPKKPVGRRVSEWKANLQHVVDSEAESGALDATPAATTTKPTTQCIEVGDAKAARLFFGGEDVEDETYSYQVILWYVMDDGNGAKDYIPRLVEAGVATLSAMEMPPRYETSAGLMADTVTKTITDDGTAVESPADDTLAMLYLHCRGAAILQVQTSLNSKTAAKADVWVQLGE